MNVRFGILTAALVASGCHAGGGTLPQTLSQPPQANASQQVARAKSLFVSPLTVPGKIVRLAASSSGSVAPSTTITSKAQIANFGLSYFLAYDPSNNRLWVTSCMEVGLSGGPVIAFDADSRGKSPADVLLVGKKTGLSGCQTGIATDVNGNVFVADLANRPAYPGGQVAVFGSDQQGNVAPIARIAGSNAALHSPEGVALDAKGNLYVANSCQGFSPCTSGVNVYKRGASGNVKPTRVIGGNSTTIAQAFGVALDASGNLYVSDAASNAIDVFAANASGNVQPIRRIVGSKTSLHMPSGIAIDRAGYLYVGNFDQSTASNNWPVLVFKPLAAGNARPVQVIHIQTSRFTQPSGIAVR